MDIDSSKAVHLFVHGRKDLEPKAREALASSGFGPENIVPAVPQKAGQVGDYMAMLWNPGNPDHIKVQRITAVDENAKPEGMAGVWTGVSKDDLFTVKL